MSRTALFLKAGVIVTLAAGLAACNGTATGPVNDADRASAVTLNVPKPPVSTATQEHDVMPVSASVTSMAVAAVPMQFFPNGWQWPLRTSAWGTGGAAWLASGCNGKTEYLPGKTHIGFDMPAALGTPVYPVSAGKVEFVSRSGWSDGSRGLANVGLFVRHSTVGGSVLVLYGHVVSALSTGMSVSPDRALGTVGDYGGTHLHLGVTSSLPLTGTFGAMPCASSPGTNGFVNPLMYLGNTLPLPRADLAALDAQAVRDILARARPDWRFTTPSTTTVSADLRWDANFQLRWAVLNFAGNRRVAVYQATNVWNSAVRYTGFFDPDRGNAWQGWFAAN